MAKDIEPKLKLISDYLKIKRNEFFIIPEYQRGYSWNIQQCDKLWQDVVEFMESNSDDPYFFGTIIVDCSEPDGFSLIDGQQRTTTFLLLLKAMQLRLKEVLKSMVKDEDTEALEEGLKDNRNRILEILYKTDVDGRFAIIKDWNNTAGISILKNKSINEQYKSELNAILAAETFQVAELNCYKIPRKQKDNKYTKFFRNFKYFYCRLCEYNESRLNSFVKTFLNKCQIIEIRSWQIEQAITMFNSLNSTGMPLSDADIISAQLYSNAGDDKLPFNNLWEDVTKLASDLSIRKITNTDAVLQQYMYIYRAQTQEYKKNDSIDVTTPGLRNYYTNIKKDLLKNPLELCAHFKKITQIWDKIKDYPSVKLLLKFNENAKIYLISYLFRFDPNEIDEIKVLGVLECLLRLFTILELVDTGYSSSNFKTFLFGENIKLVEKGISIEEITNDFDIHISKNWKEDQLFQQLNEYDRNILVYLNEYLYAKNKGLKFDFMDSVNVEHIMPASGHNIETIRLDAGIQSKEEFDSIVNKLGNKILLEEDINKSIGREWFKTKKQKSVNEKLGYKDSKYGIAQDISNYQSDTWGKTEIEKATNHAVNRIINFIYNK